jgi:PKD repeat protein
MRKFLVFFSMMVVAGFMAVNLTSCGDDPMPLPTVKLLADVDPNDQYKVNLTVEATDATTYAWDYGDGNASVAGESHSYTYAASGDYTIKVTVTNESGTASATANVTINPSVKEMLAGVNATGKSWVVSKAVSANDGAGPLHPSQFNISLPFALVGDPLAYVGFPDEYDNVFTFKPDGKYTVDNVNGQNLCTQIYAYVATGGAAPGDGWIKGDLGFATMSYTSAANPTWKVEEGVTIEMDVMSDDPATPSEYTPMHVKYENVTRVSVQNSYFGLLDLSNYVIIENIAPDKMQVLVLMHTEIPDKLSIFARLTMVPKS